MITMISMKKIVLALVVFALAFSLTAQQSSVQSISHGTSFSIYENEIDHMFNVGPDFLALAKLYIYTGLSKRSVSNADSDTEFEGGMFLPGSLPMSFYVNVFSGSNTQIGSSTNISTGSLLLDKNGNQVGYDSETTTKVTGQWADGLSMDFGYNIGIGETMAVGLSLEMEFDDNNSNNMTTTDQYALKDNNVDVEKTLTTTVTSEDAGDSRTTIAAAVPFYLATGSLQHTVSVAYSNDHTNKNSLSKTEYSNITSDDNLLPGLGDTPLEKHTDITTLNSETDHSIDLGYDMDMPGFIAGQSALTESENTFSAGMQLAVGIKGYQNETTNRGVFYTGRYDVADKYSETKNTEERTYGIDFDITLNAGHSFYWDVMDNLTFGIAPGFELVIDTNGSTAFEKTETTTSIVTDDNGNTSKDTYGTSDSVTTTTYSKEGSETRTVRPVLTLPVAVSFKPLADLPLTIVAGGYGSFAINWTHSANYVPVITNTKVEDKLDSANDRETKTDILVPNPAIDSTVNYITSFRTNLGFSWMLSDDAHIDFLLSGGVGGDFFNFNGATFQFVIGL